MARDDKAMVGGIAEIGGKSIVINWSAKREKHKRSTI